METEVAAQPFEPWDLARMSTHPMARHDKDVSEFSVGEKCCKSQDWRLSELSMLLGQNCLLYEVAGSGRHS